MTSPPVTPPKFSYKQKQVLNDEQLAIFMEAVREDTVWHDLLHTELTTGLRRGEFCGLMWQDFDEADGTVSIRRTVRREKGGILTTGDTKTYAGTRKIVLPPSTAQLDMGIAKAEPRLIEKNAPQERTMTTFQARKRWSPKAG